MFLTSSFGGSAVNRSLDHGPKNRVVGGMIGSGAVSDNGVTQGLIGPGVTPPPVK